MNRRYFPFSGVVGQEDLKLCLMLALVAPDISGLLISGAKGSAKTTLVRAVKELLPEPSKFVEMPLGVTEDRVKGSIDIGKTLSEKAVHVQDGLLGKANGGVLYVDEINLLPDHIVDLILDAAATGVNIVEREGVSVVQDARFVLIGTMNPEEGELRPQLLDRFGLSITVHDSLSKEDRVEAIKRRLAFDNNSCELLSDYFDNDKTLKSQLASARSLLDQKNLNLMLSEEIVSFAVDLALDIGAEGLRADLTLLRASLALSALEGHDTVKVEHVKRVAPFVFAHRKKISQSRTPSQGGGDEHTSEGKSKGSSKKRGTGDSGDGKRDPREYPSGFHDVSDSRGNSTRSQRTENNELKEGSKTAIGDGEIKDVALMLHPNVAKGESWKRLGREERTTSTFLPGSSINLAASILKALEDKDMHSSNVVISESTLVFRSRQKIAESTVIFVVDISRSMGVESRVALVKEVAASLLSSAYVKRLKVALVVFGGREATVALRPTRSLEVVRARLESLTYMGRTPLDSAIELARELAIQEMRKGVEPMLVFITDGRANFTNSNDPPFERAVKEAREIKSSGITAMVCDFDLSNGGISYAKEISTEMGATYLEIAKSKL